MYEILINILIFAGILLLLALTVAVVQGFIILIDIRRMTKEIKEKMLVVTSVFDIVTLLLGGVEGAKKKFKKKLKTNDSTLVAFLAGLKKSLRVLLKKEE